MSREVLSPNPAVLVPPDPSEAAKRRGADRFGNASRAREVAAEKVADPAPAAGGDPAAPPAAPGRTARPPPSTAGGEAGATAQPPARAPAYAAAYFNKDVAATDRPSPHAQAQRALRGSRDVTDLKKVVLPAGATQTVSPEALWRVGERMGVGQGLPLPELRDLLARLGGGAQAPGMTVERLRARLAQLEEMVATRRLALARMPAAQRAARPGLSLQPAGDLAGDLAGAAAEGDDGRGQDPVARLSAAANQRVQAASAGAAGMHQRLARTLGVKDS